MAVRQTVVIHDGVKLNAFFNNVALRVAMAGACKVETVAFQKSWLRDLRHTEVVFDWRWVRREKQRLKEEYWLTYLARASAGPEWATGYLEERRNLLSHMENQLQDAYRSATLRASEDEKFVKWFIRPAVYTLSTIKLGCDITLAFAPGWGKAVGVSYELANHVIQANLAKSDREAKGSHQLMVTGLESVTDISGKISTTIFAKSHETAAAAYRIEAAAAERMFKDFDPIVAALVYDRKVKLAIENSTKAMHWKVTGKSLGMVANGLKLYGLYLSVKEWQQSLQEAQ